MHKYWVVLRRPLAQLQPFSSCRTTFSKIHPPCGRRHRLLIWNCTVFVHGKGDSPIFAETKIGTVPRILRQRRRKPRLRTTIELDINNAQTDIYKPSVSGDKESNAASRRSSNPKIGPYSQPDKHNSRSVAYAFARQ